MSQKISLSTLSPEEQDKAAIEATLALSERYARAGQNRRVLRWLEDRLRLMQGELRRNISRLDEEEALRRKAESGRKIIKVDPHLLLDKS